MSNLGKTQMLNYHAFQILGPVAQGLEQLAHNQLVAGSNPARPTIKNVVILGNKRENKKSLKKVLTYNY